MVIYTKLFFTAGLALGPLILIDKKYEGDVGLIVHETIHTAQWQDEPFTFHIKYLFSKKHRLAYELEAYSAQSACYQEDKTHLFAERLSKNYFLDIDVTTAWDMLKNAFHKKL